MSSRVSRIHHVSLIVSDTARSAEFYTLILGFEVDHSRNIERYPGAWLRSGDAELHLLELPNPDPVDGRPEHVGLDRHVALCVPDLADVMERLEKSRIAFTRSRSGRAALFFRDPDGNGIELVQAVSSS